MNIVFDFDGTLLDSSQRHTTVLAKCLSEFGLCKTNLSDYLHYKADGNNTKKYLQERIGLKEHEAKEIAMRWVQLIENSEFLSTDFLYSDSIKTLDFFKSNGFKLFLCSARQNEEALAKQIELFKLNDFFAEVSCALPKNALQEKTEFIKRTEAACVIGDTETEFFAAKNANATPYILNRGFRSRAYLDSLNIKSYDSLDEISSTIIKKNKTNTV